MCKVFLWKVLCTDPGAKTAGVRVAERERRFTACDVLASWTYLPISLLLTEAPS